MGTCFRGFTRVGATQKSLAIFWLTAVGLGLGLAGAWGGIRVVESMLFGVSTTDPVTFLGVAALLLLVALTASFIPARHGRAHRSADRDDSWMFGG